MKDDIIWELQSAKVSEKMLKGERVDGRALDEYREISIQKNLSKNAEGSAIAKIGETEVIFGTKMILGEPYPDSPDEGTIAVGVELSPIASPYFETGPPKEAAIELSRVVDRGIREAKTIDFKELCRTPGEEVWIVFIDGYTLNDTGNLFDTSALAAVASLTEVRYPKVEDGKIVKGEYEKQLKMNRTPILSTFAKISGKIVVDPTSEEEKAMTSRFSVSTTEDDYCAAFQKGGQGSFTKKEIDECLETAFKRAKEIRQKVK